VRAEPDALPGRALVLVEPAAAGDSLVQPSGEDREGSGRAAVVVQLSALGRQPADQPDVDPAVAVDALVPAPILVVVDVRVLAARDLVGVEASELDQLERGEIETFGAGHEGTFDRENGRVDGGAVNTPRRTRSPVGRSRARPTDRRSPVCRARWGPRPRVCRMQLALSTEKVGKGRSAGDHAGARP